MRSPATVAWILAGCLLVLTLGTAHSGLNATHKAALHVVPHGTNCKTIPAFTSCSGITTTYPGTGDIDVVPVFFDLNGCTFTVFGLTWPAEWGTCGYTTCLPGFSIGQIVAPGDGITTAWAGCRYDWALAHGIGWLYATGPGAVALVPEPITRELGVGDCQEGSNRAHDWPITTSAAGVGGILGDDACESSLLPLSITVTNDLDSSCVTGGSDLTYTATYGNTANAAEVSNVVLILGDRIFDVDAEYISFSPGGVYSYDNHSVMWQIGALAPGEIGTRQIVLRIPPDAADPLVVTGGVTSNRTPRSEHTLVSQVCAQDTLPLDLYLFDALGACAIQGQNFTFTLWYGNPRNAFPVHNVVLTDHMPSEVNFVSASAGGVYDPGSHSVSWHLGTLQTCPGDRHQVTVTAHVLAEPGVTLLSNCEIQADEPVRKAIVGRTEVCGATGQRNTNLKIAIHVRPHDTTCSSLPDFTSCQGISTTYPACGDLDFIPVFFDQIECSGLVFGVNWPQDWGSCEFTLCSGDIWYGPIVQPGDGLSVGWSTCQQRWSIAPGYGWLSATGAGRICPVLHPVDGTLGVINCQLPYSTFDPVTAVYCAGACGALGDAACPTTRAEPSTWGAIKSMFR